MPERYLRLDDIRNALNAEMMGSLFGKLGYNAGAEPLKVSELDLPPESENAVKDAYLIADTDRGGLQVLLFELQALEFRSPSAAKSRMSEISESMLDRPTHFLLLATTDYKQLILANPYQDFDDDWHLQTKIRSWFVDLTNPTYYDIYRLEAIASVTDDAQELYRVQCDAFEFLEQKSSYEVDPLDSIGIYLEEIGRRPLLRASEEIQLGRQVSDLMKLEAVRSQLRSQQGREPQDREWARAVNMSASEQDFLDLLNKGRKAKNKMVSSNLRLVVSIAKRYQHRGVDFQDLIQEGNLGLIRAVEKFDPSMGYKFSTYATWWIRRGMFRAIANQSRVIRLPIHITQKLNKIKQAHKQLSKQLGRTATIGEVGGELELTPTQIQEYLKLLRQPLCLDLPLEPQEDTPLVETLIDESFSEESELVQSCLKNDLKEVMLDKLKPEHRKVLSWRFGLEDEPTLTRKQIGDRLNLSRERIRQIESQSFTILRKHQNILRPYINSDFVVTVNESPPAKAPPDREQLSVRRTKKKSPITIFNLSETNSKSDEIMKKNIVELRLEQGYSKEEILFILWGVSSVDLENYDKAEAEYLRLMGE